MDINNQFYHFYKPYLKKTAHAIKNGKSLIFLGINSIGKTLLSEQILSKKFLDEYFHEQKVHLVFLEFKDKNPPTTEQLYRYWLVQTAKVFHKKVPQKEVLNDFSFYSLMSEMVKSIPTDEKIAFIILDFQNIRDQIEAVFRSLIYLEWYSYGKVSYIALSEPQILDYRNSWLQKFIQRLTHHKFHFLPTFDRKTTLSDIKREEALNKSRLTQPQRSLIVKHAGGLHGVIGAYSYLLRDNPQVKTIKKLSSIVENDQMCHFWFKDLLDSLPVQSVKILKELTTNNKKFTRYSKTIYGKWLVDLGFLKRNGELRFRFLSSVINNYVLKEQTGRQLVLRQNKFYSNGDRVILTTKEFLVLRALFKRKGKLESYDQIGEILWGDTQEKFSLWAISQIIRRIRNRLSDYFIHPSIIRSKRGEGYVLN